MASPASSAKPKRMSVCNSADRAQMSRKISESVPTAMCLSVSKSHWKQLNPCRNVSPKQTSPAPAAFASLA